MICPCGSGQSYKHCCEVYIQGVEQAPSPECLMRSRYSAYALREMDYVARSWHSSTVPLSLESDPNLRWIGLDVIKASQVGDTGWVEFSARAIVGDELRVLYERSRFVREQGRWFYIEGDVKESGDMQTLRIGRNQACPCGSGNKFKRCCAGVGTS